jgi:hypothetical protein
MYEERYYSGAPNGTSIHYDRAIRKARMGYQRLYQVLDEDTRNRESAKNVQVGAMAHKPLIALPFLL